MHFNGEEAVAIASHKSNAADVFACMRKPCFALLPALAALAMPAAASADIYKWTDEQGRITISNVPPATLGKASKLELVLKEPKPASISKHPATPTEQALLARIEALERELRARQYAAPAPAAAAPPTYGGYYPPAPPPPPPPSYYSGGYASSYPGYYPSTYYPVATSYVVYPARSYVAQPAYVAPRGGYAHGGGHAHGGGAHRGRR